MKTLFKRILTISLVLILGVFAFVGCSGNDYEQISAAQAKAIMDSETNYVIVDVRRYDDEYALGHIKNAINIPNEVIEQQAESILTDKDQLILVYCRSGNRSKKACETLVKLGYTNVKEFGGIINWPYGTVTD